MPNAKPPSDRALTFAAQLRTEGLTWPAVAKQLRRSVHTVRKWPMVFAERWKAAQGEAERRVAADAEGESVLILRQLLRADDDKIRATAARSLVGLRIDLLLIAVKQMALNKSGNARSATQLLVDMLETQSDEDLAKLVTSEIERTSSEHPEPPATSA